jgi:hypothetical protein
MIEYNLKIILSNNNDGYVNLPLSILKIHQNNFPFFIKIKTELNFEYIIGVKEFTTEENFIEIPEWLMNHLYLNPFDNINIHIISKPPNLEYLSLETNQKEFFDIPNYEIYLEKHLSNFSTITINQNINLIIKDHNYNFNVIALNNNDIHKFYSLNNLDINVDIIYKNNLEESIKEDNFKEKVLTKEELREQRLKYFSK